MIKKTITAFLLAAALYAPQAAANTPPPFTSTAITDDQKFASNTIWYTLQIGSNEYYLSKPNAEGQIDLTKALSDFSDADLWCFVGNDTEG